MPLKSIPADGIRRAADVVGALGGLVAMSPVMLAAALAIIATDGRPVLYRQERIGRGGRPFQILKFRSMRNGAPGIQVSSDRDPRITRVGAVLRRTKIDELPQLVNVLRGEMGIVGPRPEVARYVEHWPDDLRDLILSARPGITDPASVVYRHESEILARSDDPEQTYIEELLPRKAQMYAQYVRSRSLLGDLRVVLETVRAVVGR